MNRNFRNALAVLPLMTAVVLSGCTVYGPPLATRPGPQPSSARRGMIQQPPAAAQPVAPLQSTPAPEVPPPAVRHFQLSAPAAALVSMAQAQQRDGNFGLAAQTLERALSIEPRNPLVWMALGKESLAAGNPAQAYGMARKALYLAGGAPDVQASAWGLIAAALRAEGRNQAAVAAERKAAELFAQ